MKPSMNEDCQDARGSFSTGIIEAHITSDRGNKLLWNTSGTSFHPGLRSGAQARITTHTATPIAGKFPTML